MNTSKIIVLLLTSFFLTACAGTRINHPPAPLQQQSIVEQFHLNENESRVHFFSGEFINKLGWGVTYNEAFEVYINDVKVGVIGNKNEYMAIDLRPGIYNFKWVYIGPPPVTPPEVLQLSIKNKELIFLKANMYEETPTAAILLANPGKVFTKFILRFDQDLSSKNNMREYTLISLNQDIKESLLKK